MRSRYDFSRGIRGKYASKLDSHGERPVPSSTPMVRHAYSHGEIATLGDDETLEEDTDWTPENDPDQLHYNEPIPGDDESDDASEEQDDADEGEDTGDLPSRNPLPAQQRNRVLQATNGLMQGVRAGFSQVSTRAMPQGLRRRSIVLALFVHDDGRVKVLR